MNLLDHLQLADPLGLALATEASSLQFQDLIAEAEGLRAALGEVRGIRLFLNIADPVAAVIALAALDGVAGALILSSPTLDAATVAVLAARAEADAILSDRNDLLEEIPVVHRVADLALVPVSRVFGGATDWVMTTSGTTGRPKLVAHGLDSLTRTTKQDQLRGRAQVWGLLYDYTRFAGLQVMLQSLLSGAVLGVPSADLSLEGRIAFLAGMGVTHLSATPTFWRKVLMTPGAERLALRQITLGGEIADDTILSALTRRYPGARVSHIFASTEAGVGFSVTDGRAGFPVIFLDEPPLGIGLQIRDGRLFIRNERVASHYLGGEGELACDGWVDTGDQVRVNDQRVLFLGRSNGVINVGGDKVHPEEVEAVILSHPAVEMVRVYAKKNPIVGALVATDIMPRPGCSDHAALREELKHWLATRLERHKVPAFIRIVEEFETNAAGKLKRGE
ncbi:ANL family adenylate-forming protein [Pararhizobium polonicum]|uniref:ANL family adenylate-forming protein n=1 Tax=Pararhizobium polonicum TaxID=1612624 RepID=UPI00083B91B2|nr:fatty acid--CoA ligase family protein [Pararhizobium polonicum]